MEGFQGPIVIRLFPKDSASSNSKAIQNLNISISNDDSFVEELGSVNYDKNCLKKSAFEYEVPENFHPCDTKSDPEWTNSSVRRMFVKNWKNRFSFLEYDCRKKVMFCKICQFHSTSKQKKLPFVRGTRNFRLSAIQFHQNSTLHTRCLKLATQSKDTLNFLNHDKESVINILKLVYLMVKSKSPFIYYPQLCENQKKLNMDLGLAYTSHHKVVTIFSNYIASNIEKKVSEKIKHLKMFSLVLDSSFSRGTESHEVVYIKYIDGASVKTLFLGVVQSKDVSGKDMFENLTKLFEKFSVKQWYQMVVFIMADLTTAPPWIEELVMLVKTTSSRSFIGLIPILSHKIHQIYGAAKILSSKNEFWITISSIYQYYSTLPDDERTLTYISKEFDSITEVYGELPRKGYFVPLNVNALEAVDKDWCLLIDHLKQKSTNPNLQNKKDARKVLSSIAKLSFILKLGLYLDAFKMLSDFAKNLEDDSFLPFKICNVGQNLCELLKSASKGEGSVFQRYLSDINLTSSTFRDVSINLDQNQTFVCNEVQIHLEPLIDFFQNEVVDKLAYLKSTESFDYKNWRTHKNDDNPFSNHTWLQECDSVNIQVALSEWHELNEKVKSLFSSVYTSKPRKFLLEVIHNYHNEFPVVTNILKKIALFDFSFVELQRGYKEMNLVKSSDRSTLSVNSLQSSMMIVMHGPPFSKFNPFPALEMWLTQCRRRYKIRSKLKTSIRG